MNIIVLIMESSPMAKAGSGLAVFGLIAVTSIYPFVRGAQYFDKQRRLNNGVKVEAHYLNSEFDDNVPKYTYGVYYSYFEFEVQTPKEEIQSFEMRTLVWKHNECIGYLSSSFYGPDVKDINDKGATTNYFKPKETYKLKAYLDCVKTQSGNRINDGLFAAIYYEGSSFTYETRIITTFYSDYVITENSSEDDEIYAGKDFLSTWTVEDYSDIDTNSINKYVV